jgi:hypothetical protein
MFPQNSIRTVGFLMVGLLLVAGCSSSGDPDQAGWERVEQMELSERNLKLYKQAEKARGELASTLMSRVTEVMQKDGPAQAVEVCNLEAQGLTQDVAEKHGVDIGRTSFRLRNPDNTPPEWAREFDLIEDRVEKQVILKRQQQSELAVLSPIRLAEKCTACHGKKDQLAPGVQEELAKRYPEDEATGFEAGDLRGWFWVEVDSS